ncbi:MAG TPA: aminotransferase class IV [Candidatus Alistipes faecigallinarum]|nr:aminotransferase class IV [Candidatus Alistipes faecigallinarum]
MNESVLYQIVHLARGRARNVEEHAALLDAASRALFRRPYRPDLRALATRIERHAAAEHYPTGVSGFIRIELNAEGEESLRPEGISLYDGYALRSLHPDAATLRYEPLCPDLPTSAREATERLAAQIVRSREADVAVRCDGEGRLLSADNAPLFALRDETAYLSPTPPGVEAELLCETIRALGMPLRREALRRSDLPRIEELFYVDHRGITALAHCDGMPLMTLRAEQLAEALEQRFRKM